MDVFQPPPLYPPLISRPLNLDKNEQLDKLVEIKSNFRNLMKDSFYYIENKFEKNDFDQSIQRYSDRYSKTKKVDLEKWTPDWSRLPKELKHFYEKEEKSLKSKRKTVVPKLIKRKVKKEADLDIEKLVEKIAGDEDQEENDENEETEEKVKKKVTESDEEENQEELENADEEDIEEENDYIDTYFDNGENYGDDDLGGGDDEGPTY